MADRGFSASPLVPGYRLDRYELLCPIAEGGMASVWVARLRAKHGFEKLVAVKTILPQHAQDPRFQQMFLDEARIASKIDHVNVAHVLDLGDEHGVLYLVMEWVDGDSLSKLVRAIKTAGGDMPLGIALRIVADVCAGLHAAHELRDAEGNELRVVHRDVSPQNVLVAQSGIAKVIDFGIAKARDRLSGETSTGSLKGKIQFMAPEQAVGKPIDRRADIWSTGSVLYTLLAGDPPYDEMNQYATLHRIASGQRPPPLPARVPKQVAAIVDRALAFDPDARFATMAEMGAEIEAVLEDLGLAATSRDVAELAALHLAARADQRRKSVDLAMRAAAERDRVAKILTDGPASEPSPLPVLSRESGRSRIETIVDAPMARGERTEPSIRSLGVSSLTSVPPPASPRASRRRFVAGTVAVATAVLLFALGRMTTRSPSTAPPVAAVSVAAPPPAASAPPAEEPAAPAPAPPAVAPAAPASSAVAIAHPSLPPPRVSAPRRVRPAPSASPAPASPPPRKGSVDDGF